MMRIGFGRLARRPHTPFQQALSALLNRADLPVGVRLHAVRVIFSAVGAPCWKTANPTLDGAKRHVSIGKHFPTGVPVEIVDWFGSHMAAVYRNPPKLPLKLALNYYLNTGRYSRGPAPSPDGERLASIEFAFDNLVADAKVVIRWAAEDGVSLAGLDQKTVVATARAWQKDMNARMKRRRKLRDARW